MAQFSRLVAEIDAILDDVESAKGTSASLTAKINTLQTDIAAKAPAADLAAEVTARENADAALQTALDGKATVSDVYGLGTTIESGTDLDSLTSVGVYNCLTNQIASTLSNCPTANGFRLEVISTISDTSYQIQQLYPNNSNGEFFIRRRVASGWSGWTRFAADTSAYLIGTTLNADDDLDNYITAGRYYAGTSISGSILNRPVASTYGFELTVENNTISTRVIQTITYNTSNALHIGKLYKRWYTSEGWSAWYVYEGTAVSG